MSYRIHWEGAAARQHGADMHERRVASLRHGFIGTCALAAIVMLGSFYAIVSGAVERAAKQRVASVEAASAIALATLPSRPARAGVLFAGVGN